MNELVEYAQLLMNFLQQSGASLNADSQRALGSMLQNILQVIEQQSQVGLQPPTPELDNAPFASAQINAFKYDPKRQELFIKYQDKYPGQNGPVYRYSEVPAFIYNIFARGAVGPLTTGKNAWHAWKQGVTPSLGAAANALIKAGGFAYQRVS